MIDRYGRIFAECAIRCGEFSTAETNVPNTVFTGILNFTFGIHEGSDGSQWGILNQGDSPSAIVMGMFLTNSLGSELSDWQSD
jgi:hypothetical protein